jgi:hypothetical protein
VRLVALIFALSALTGCVTFTDGPTQNLVDRELQKTKKLVQFSSPLTPAAIRDRTVASGCGPGQVTTSGLAAPAPGLYVPVVSKNDFTVQEGSWPDGSLWVVLRMDGMIHAIPSGMKLAPSATGGAEVTVMAADIRKLATIQQRVEEGTLFCHWREFDYPYD